jgi:hypothetical protein
MAADYHATARLTFPMISTLLSFYTLRDARDVDGATTL